MRKSVAFVYWVRDTTKQQGAKCAHSITLLVCSLLFGDLML
jgi:hypothetical protein